MVAQSGKTTLDDSTYNILVALGTEADFIHSTVDTYISDAQKENKTELVEVIFNRLIECCTSTCVGSVILQFCISGN